MLLHFLSSLGFLSSLIFGVSFFADTVREFLRQVRANKASLKSANILFIGSTAGIFGEAEHADYSTSKSALNGIIPSRFRFVFVLKKC
jgi:NAD(P)-dependent dehydrogenase (short-subunit alcohol dehydrogenase family)